jgi:hypothetical protein
MEILMKVHCSILTLADGMPTGMKKTEVSELYRQLMSFIP